MEGLRQRVTNAAVRAATPALTELWEDIVKASLIAQENLAVLLKRLERQSEPELESQFDDTFLAVQELAELRRAVEAKIDQVGGLGTRGRLG